MSDWETSLDMRRCCRSSNHVGAFPVPLREDEGLALAHRLRHEKRNHPGRSSLILRIRRIGRQGAFPEAFSLRRVGNFAHRVSPEDRVRSLLLLFPRSFDDSAKRGVVQFQLMSHFHLAVSMLIDGFHNHPISPRFGFGLACKQTLESRPAE